jgi:hypothetical protein
VTRAWTTAGLPHPVGGRCLDGDAGAHQQRTSKQCPVRPRPPAPAVYRLPGTSPERRDSARPQPGSHAAAEHHRPHRRPPEPERRRVQAPLVHGPRHRPIQRKRDSRPHNQGSSDRSGRPLPAGKAPQGEVLPTAAIARPARPRLRPGRTDDAQTGGSPVSPGLWRWPLHVAAPGHSGAGVRHPSRSAMTPARSWHPASPRPPCPQTGGRLNRLCSIRGQVCSCDTHEQRTRSSRAPHTGTQPAVRTRRLFSAPTRVGPEAGPATVPSD